MIQRFSKLQRIDQSLAVSILLIQLIQAPAGEHKRGNPFAIAPEADPAQLTTSAQKERSSKNVSGLKAVFDQKITPFLKKKLSPNSVNILKLYESNYNWLIRLILSSINIIIR